MAKDDELRIEAKNEADEQRAEQHQQMLADSYPAELNYGHAEIDYEAENVPEWSTDGEQQLGYMDRVVFTQVENGSDIIISFSFEDGTQFGVGGFLILRTPQFEHALPPQSCGPSVLLAGFLDGLQVTEVYLTPNEIKLVITNGLSPFHFDLSKISDEEYQELIEHFNYINFDQYMKFVY
jgi:hypothetical protein